MKELNAILTAYSKTDVQQQRVALATVVSVKGSSYRSPGARMLITDDGKWTGSISGGCLEGDALRKARGVMASKIPMTVTYDTREESNQNLGIGLGCNGVIDVLIEPVEHTKLENTIGVLENLVEKNQLSVLATIFRGPSHVGKKIILENGLLGHSDFTNVLHADLIQKDLDGVLSTGKSQAKYYHTDEGMFEVFIELIQPNISLIIFGGGFDARPVSQLAKSIGWNVIVTDECVAHIAPIFFPEANKLSLCHRDFINRDFNITPYTACILMSHNYDYDRDVLRQIINSETAYIGILGPRKRFEKMMIEFSHENIQITALQSQKIHSPIGLDIGAETPDEIALSIIAEIQGKFANRSGGFLKYRSGPIHHRDAASDQVFKQIFLHDKDDKSQQATG